MAERRIPLWLWPNLLSLDAPIVAVVWLAMFARTWRVDFLQWESYLALGLATWVIYVVDRLLDVKLLHSDDPRLGERHGFLKRHQKKLGWMVLAAGLGCVFMDNHIPIVIFDLGQPGNITRALRGESIGTIVDGEETVVA